MHNKPDLSIDTYKLPEDGSYARTCRGILTFKTHSIESSVFVGADRVCISIRNTWNNMKAA
jgi:hypothetical protein